MKKWKVFTFVCAALMSFAVNSFALEYKGAFKGNIHNIYPDAVIIKTEFWIQAQSKNTFEDLATQFAVFQMQSLDKAEKFAMGACANKSMYASVENFEIPQPSAIGNSVFISASANAICFDLPKSKSLKK